MEPSSSATPPQSPSAPGSWNKPRHAVVAFFVPIVLFGVGLLLSQSPVLAKAGGPEAAAGISVLIGAVASLFAAIVLARASVQNTFARFVFVIVIGPMLWGVQVFMIVAGCSSISPPNFH